MISSSDGKKAHKASYNRRRAAGTIFLIEKHSAVQLRYGKLGKKKYILHFFKRIVSKKLSKNCHYDT